MVGYQSREYAAALANLGTPRPLLHAGGWWLERAIPGSSLRDGCGPYPLLCCGNWCGLNEDLLELEGEIVSFTAVTDPFGSYDEKLLQQTFPDLLLPYKEHLVAELQSPEGIAISAHHRRKLRKAAGVVVQMVDPPQRATDDWVALYGLLISRHAIEGVAAFTPAGLTSQLNTPGLTLFRADVGGEPACIHLWLRVGQVVYYHLGASTAAGYAAGASYALVWHVLQHYRAQGVEMANFGAAPDASVSAEQGLLRFKSGWATTTRQTYLAGRILDPTRYTALSAGLAGDYFPLYRKPRM